MHRSLYSTLIRNYYFIDDDVTGIRAVFKNASEVKLVGAGNKT